MSDARNEVRWRGPTVGGVDCNAPETAVWTAVFAAFAAAAVPPLVDSQSMRPYIETARRRANIVVVELRRVEAEAAANRNRAR